MTTVSAVSAGRALPQIQRGARRAAPRPVQGPADTRQPAGPLHQPLRDRTAHVQHLSRQALRLHHFLKHPAPASRHRRPLHIPRTAARTHMGPGQPPQSLNYTRHVPILRMPVPVRLRRNPKRDEFSHRDMQGRLPDPGDVCRGDLHASQGRTPHRHPGTPRSGPRGPSAAAERLRRAAFCPSPDRRRFLTVLTCPDRTRAGTPAACGRPARNRRYATTYGGPGQAPGGESPALYRVRGKTGELLQTPGEG